MNMLHENEQRNSKFECMEERRGLSVAQLPLPGALLSLSLSLSSSLCG
jgi:hypothetical protein